MSFYDAQYTLEGQARYDAEVDKIELAEKNVYDLIESAERQAYAALEAAKKDPGSKTTTKIVGEAARAVEAAQNAICIIQNNSIRPSYVDIDMLDDYRGAADMVKRARKLLEIDYNTDDYRA